MTRHKDFGSGPDLSKLEKITFTLHNEDFTAIPVIQGKVLMELIRDSQSEDAATAADLSGRFFARVLEDESLERFNALLEDKERIVQAETLGEIIGWLLEEYTKRPEEQPED